jgi:hypothetical protein
MGLGIRKARAEIEGDGTAFRERTGTIASPS